VDCNGRTIWIADAHRDDGKRFVVRADEILTAFLELESMLMKERPYGFDQFSDDPWRRLLVRRRLPFYAKAFKNGSERELEELPIGLVGVPPEVRDSKGENTRLPVRTKTNESRNSPEVPPQCRPLWKGHAQYRVHLRAEGFVVLRLHLQDEDQHLLRI